jgi:membrane-associated PAP2 superfamily phosphatase
VKTGRAVQNAWRPDRRFWTLHLLIPLAAAASVLTLVEFTGVDVWLADRWFAIEGGSGLARPLAGL